jgi:integrase
MRVSPGGKDFQPRCCTGFGTVDQITQNEQSLRAVIGDQGTQACQTLCRGAGWQCGAPWRRRLALRRFDVLSWLILGGLVGLRPYEVLRFEWTGIHFQTREIRVEPGWTKTHRARIVPLQPNAFEWLKLVASHTAEKRGKVMPSVSTWNNRWRRWRQEEDTPLPLRWWVGKDDVLRLPTARIGRQSFETRTIWPRKWATL